MNPYELLAQAIVAQACKDYYDYFYEMKLDERKDIYEGLDEKALANRMKRHDEIVKNGINAKKYLYSDDRLAISDIDPDAVVKEIERRVKYDMRQGKKSDYRLIP